MAERAREGNKYGENLRKGSYLGGEIVMGATTWGVLGLTNQ